MKLHIERKSHGALIAAFGEHVAKPRLVDPELHHYLVKVFSARTGSDYLPAPPMTRDKARETIDRAKEFFEAARNYLQPDASGGVV